MNRQTDLQIQIHEYIDLLMDRQTEMDSRGSEGLDTVVLAKTCRRGRSHSTLLNLGDFMEVGDEQLGALQVVVPGEGRGDRESLRIVVQYAFKVKALCVI